MKLPPAWIAAAAAGLALSLALKYRYEVDYLPAATRPSGFEDLRALVTPAGFQISPGEGPDFLILKDGCLGWIGFAGRDGDFDEALRLRVGSAEIFYLYRGRISRTPPYLRAQIERYGEMLRVVAGARPRLFPMLHIALAQGCAPSILDSLRSP